MVARRTSRLMQLTIRLLGAEVLHISTDAEPEDDCSRDLSGGTTSAMPMGLVAHMDKPHEVDVPDRDWG